MNIHKWAMLSKLTPSPKSPKAETAMKRQCSSNTKSSHRILDTLGKILSHAHLSRSEIITTIMYIKDANERYVFERSKLKSGVAQYLHSFQDAKSPTE